MIPLRMAALVRLHGFFASRRARRLNWRPPGGGAIRAPSNRSFSEE